MNIFASIMAVLWATFLYFFAMAAGGCNREQYYAAEAAQQERSGQITVYTACADLEVTVYLNRGWEIIPTANRHCMKMVWKPKNK
jgi:hypothetical protein